MGQASAGGWKAGVARCLERAGRPVHLVGVGNTLRSDDGVGIRVVSSLRRSFGSTPPNWVRLHSDTPIERLARGIPAEDGVVLFDAVQTGAGPGEIVCAALGNTDYGFFATHNVPLRLIPGLAEREDSVYVIGIVPEYLELGEGLTPKVRRSADALVAEVVRQVRART